jgi:phenylacetate-CoA ligase
MSAYYDALETRNSAEREAALMAALPVQVAHAQKHSPAFAKTLSGVNPANPWPSCL